MMDDEDQYDASDEKHIAAAERKAAQDEMNRVNVVRGIMGDKKGRAWMYDIMEKCHMYSPSFIPNDPYTTAFNEGERNVGNRILADIMKAAPDQYVKMCRENSN